MSITLASNEEERLNALYSYNLLDSGQHDFSDRITEITAFALDMPIAVISLVDRSRIWFKSAYGLDAYEIPREPAFCSEAVLSDGVYEITDALAHSPTCSSELVTGILGVRYYAAAPLIDPNGFRLGTLCVLSNEPNRLNESQRKILVDLSKVTMDQILLWHRSNQLRTESQNRQRLEAKAAKREKLEALGIMVGGVAHDLNNLLMPVLANADLLKFQSKDEFITKIANEIKDAGLRGAELCGHMLTFAGGKRSEFATCRPRDCVLDGIDRFNEIYGPINILLEENEAELPMVAADASQIAQIMVNLLTNAKESVSHEQCEVRVKLSACELSQPDLDEMALLHGATPGAYVRFEIRDNGSGMDRQTLQKAMDPFFTTKEKGNGMGLSFVVGLLKNHTAPLTMNSATQEGTVIQFWLPVSRLAFAESTNSITPYSPKLRRVLLVDDEDSVRNPIANLLSVLGCEVVDASSGQEAVRIFNESESHFDLVIVDLFMPGTDGKSVTETILQSDTAPKVVIMTGNPTDQRVEECMRLGATLCLHKPFGIQTLQDVFSTIDDC